MIILKGIDKGISNDLLAMEIRQALHNLGEIAGEITTDDLLENIFSKFCLPDFWRVLASNQLTFIQNLVT